MERRTYLNILFDYYSELLTDRERTCFKDYYDDDYSITEIALNNEVSRSAVQKMIKIVEEKLEMYESKLHLLARRQEIVKKLDGVVDTELVEEIRNILS